MTVHRWLPVAALSVLFAACSAQSTASSTTAASQGAAATPAGAQAVATATTPATPADASAESSALANQLRQAIGDAACSSDAQCHTLAWGTKACGGPERWVAWSSMKSDDATVRRLAEQYGAARRADHLRTGGLSTCSIVADPGARCVTQRCVLATDAARALE